MKRRTFLAALILIRGISLPLSADQSAMTNLNERESYRLIPQTGHSRSVLDLLLVRDDTIAVSASADTTLKVWDISSGRVLRTLLGHTGIVTSLADAGSDRIVSGSFDGSVRLWNIREGVAIGKMTGHEGAVTSIAAVPDGSRILSCSVDGTLRIWSADESPVPLSVIRAADVFGIRIRTGESGEPDMYKFREDILLNSVAVSQDGRYFAFGGLSGLAVGDLDTGECVMISSPVKQGRRTVEASVYSVAFVSDTVLAVNGHTESNIKIYDLSGLSCTGGRVEGSSLLKRQIALGGRYVQEGWAGSAGENLVYFSDGEFLRLWDTDTGELYKRIPVRQTEYGAADYWTAAAAVSSDHTFLLTNELDSRFYRWNLSDYTVEATEVSAEGPASVFPRNAVSEESMYAIVTSVDADEKGRLAATGTLSGTCIWDLSTASLSAVLGKGFVGDVVLSGGGTTLAAASWAFGSIVVRDIESGDETAASGFLEEMAGIRRDREEKKIYALAEQDRRRGLQIFSFPGLEPLGSIESECGSDMTFDVSDDSFLAVGSYEGSSVSSVYARIFSFESGETVYEMSGGWDRGFYEHAEYPAAVRFSDDGRRLAVSDHNGKIHLIYKTRKGSPGPFIEKFILDGDDSGIAAMDFSPDGRRLVSGGRGGLITLWDLEGKRILAEWGDHQGPVTDVRFSRDGERIYSTSMDGTMRLRSVDNGAEWTAFMNFPGTEEWLIFTHDGYWDGSNRGGPLAAVVNGFDSWGVDQFAVRNNRPDIIIGRLGAGDREHIEHLRSAYRKRIRRMGLSGEESGIGYHVPDTRILSAGQDGQWANLTVEFSDSEEILSRYNIYVNDVPLFGAYGKPLAGHKTVLEETIRLSGGKNKIEVSCFNSSGAESYRAIREFVLTEREKGKLIFIGFGVSDYSDDSLDLKYAHKDVVDLASQMEQMADRFEGTEILTFLDRNVTRGSLGEARELLESASVDDTVVLFISGHGIHDRDAGATYYYLTHDTRMGDLASTAINFEELELLLQGIAPRKKLFLLDTCGSGEVDPDEESRLVLLGNGGEGVSSRLPVLERGLVRKDGDVPSTGVSTRYYLQDRNRYIYNDLLRRSGSVVFSSCRGEEVSYENEKYENGLFTEFIIRGLQGDADSDKNGEISVDELRSFVISTVASETGNSPEVYPIPQNPTVDRDNIYADFGF